MKRILVSMCLAIGVAAGAEATPLRLDYTITTVTPTQWKYDFKLMLDNHDSSWAPGQEWDWIIFGSNDLSDGYSSFDPDGAGPAGSNWTTTAVSAPIASTTTTSGGYNGPTLEIGTNSVVVPGWKPNAVGDFLTWSGTSGIYLPNGYLYWTVLVTGGGAQWVNQELAHEVGAAPAAVPEPASLSLLGLGLAGLVRKYRTHRR